MPDTDKNNAAATNAAGNDATKTAATVAGDASTQSKEPKEPSNPLYNKDGSSAKQGEEPKSPEADASKAGDAGSDQSEGEGTKAGEEPTTAPEKYEDFKLPEGLESNPEVMTEFMALAKEKNLSQADAQKLVDLGAKMSKNFAEKQSAMIAAEKVNWEAAAKIDKEFGGEKFEENLAIAKKGFVEFMSPEGRKMLHETGLGSHPEIIRAFYRAGKAISEDNKHVPGGKNQDASAPKDAASILYPNQTK